MSRPNYGLARPSDVWAQLPGEQMQLDRDAAHRIRANRDQLICGIDRRTQTKALGKLAHGAKFRTQRQRANFERSVPRH